MSKLPKHIEEKTCIESNCSLPFYCKKKCRIHYHRDWRDKNRIHVTNSNNTYKRKVRRLALEHYSGGKMICNCCGENNVMFLTIDHIDGKGHVHRKILHDSLTGWLRSNNYPKGFQVLCFNCNCGKSLNKNICPHKNIQGTK